MKRWFWTLALAACHGPITAETDGGAEESAAEVQVRLANRSLPATRCPGSGLVPDVSGIYAAVIETAAEVSGNLPGGQFEIITRYAIVRLCQDEDQVRGELLVCAFDQSPLVDPAGTCAAERPGDKLVAALPALALTGSVQLGNDSVILNGFDEVWGLNPGTDPPAEPGGAAVVESANLLDQDEDGNPGITVVGNGLTPTRAWLARRTLATLSLAVGQGGLAGTTAAETTQSILGGPASRALRGRTRLGRGGEALLLRADGQEGSARLDADGNGELRCAELAPWIGNPLPPPRPWPCTP